MTLISDVVVPDVLPYLFGVLALLMIWQYHQIQVMKGRILAIDVFHRTGIRFLSISWRTTPRPVNVAGLRMEASFLPNEVVKKNFDPTDGPVRHHRNVPACSSDSTALGLKRARCWNS
jgi:hypothetical protein